MLSVPLLESLAPAERDRSLDLADRVAAAAHRWMSDHLRMYVTRQDPVILAARTATHSVATTLALPTLSIADLTTLACLRLWAQALTDDAAGEELGGNALTAMRRRLSRRPLFPVFGKQWHAGMLDALRAAAVLRSWSVEATPELCCGPLPGWDEYLDTAVTALALRPYTLAACILSGAPDGWAEVGRLDPIVQAAGRCLLLAEDLHARGSLLTAAVLVQRALVAQGLAERPAGNQARAHLRAKCAVDLAFLRTQAQVAPPARAALAGGLCRYTTFVCQSYEFDDLRRLSPVAA